MAVKIYLCTKIEYIQIDNVESVSESGIAILDGYSINTISAKSASFTESLSVDINDFVSQSLSFSAVGESKNNNYTGKKFIFRLTFSDGNQIVWGDLELPVRIDKLKSNTNDNTFTFKRVGKTFSYN